MRVDQQLRGTTAWNNAQVFPNGTFTWDTDLHNIRVHDGVTAGGWVVPGLANIPAFATLEFLATANYSTPGTLPNTVAYSLATISVAGTYTLPAVSTITLGGPILFKPTVAGVVIAPGGSDTLLDHNTSGNLNLVQYEVCKITRSGAASWQVINRY